MTQLKVTPTKSNLLKLRKQLAFALEGFELLEQKRQILTLELVARLERLREAERKANEALGRAHDSLREATLDSGSEALDRVALGVPVSHEIALSEERLMGLRLPKVRVQIAPPRVSFGFTGSSPNADLAQRRFAELLPLLAELAGLQNAILRLAKELRKTQRRCNALTKIFIPDCRESIHYITGALEERERESFMDRKLR
ncbi:V-type ATP synthase subunit D [Holophaga foetida]|uniref:V-type ATP synthase subunit D n=1 Tax=Holophaga foetida TaxID=35839 RepID=UPI0002472AB9|nr:V-type ATP synthase subunit D [Holophaga foetida]